MCISCVYQDYWRRYISWSVGKLQTFIPWVGSTCFFLPMNPAQCCATSHKCSRRIRKSSLLLWLEQCAILRAVLRIRSFLSWGMKRKADVLYEVPLSMLSLPTPSLPPLPHSTSLFLPFPLPPSSFSSPPFVILVLYSIHYQKDFFAECS